MCGRGWNFKCGLGYGETAFAQSFGCAAGRCGRKVAEEWDRVNRYGPNHVDYPLPRFSSSPSRDQSVKMVLIMLLDSSLKSTPRAFSL
jgi:hypothetical protein